MPTKTFLFVDQVGSTEQLSRLGDRAGHAVRTALFDLLRQASQLGGGEEVDFTGDGLFCAFEGAAEAVDAAIAMQQLVWSFNRRQPAERRLGIRVGLNTGEPLESEGGGYFGVAVVVAARLCSNAVEGQVLASQVVQGLVAARGTYGFTPVGIRSLKGLPEPVTVFAVDWEPDEHVAVLPRALKLASSGPFVGRSRELAAAADAWASVTAGGRRLVLISGDSGIGTTRFAAEVAGRLIAGGAAVWFGRGEGMQARLAGWSDALSEWSEQSSRADLRLAMGERAGELLRLSPGLTRFFPRLKPAAPMDPGVEVFLVADALDEMIARWTPHQPLLMVFDRLEAADQASLSVLRRLLESPRPGRLLILACYQPAEVGARLALNSVGQLPGVVDLRLTGLSQDEVRELMSAVTGEPATDASVRAVMAESEGSPYFVLQMATTARAGRITRDVSDAVGRAEALRKDLRLQREEIVLGLRQLEQLRTVEPTAAAERVEPDGTPPAEVPCPYRGLLAFEEADADNFFGREQQVAELIARLVSNRFLAVVGPSGSGKSSIIRAGLLPALSAGAITGSDSWSQLVWTPVNGSLGSALTEGMQSSGEHRLVLVVDQAEQLWTAVDTQTRAVSLDLLVQSVTDPQGRVAAVMVIRADYYGHAADHADLAQLIADSQLILSPMTAAELRASIEGPARRAGLLLEPGLAQAVIDDIGDEPGALPLLSTALLETWERRRGRSLTLAGYAETGGARRAIAQLADAAYDQLTAEQQDAARRLLLRLATPTGSDDDEVARPAPLAEVTGDPVTEQVLTRFVQRRLLTVGRTTVQVAHEALLREWPKLRLWLTADREGRRLHQQIAVAAAEWDAGGHTSETLLRGVRLAAAADWAGDHDNDLSPAEREFIHASVEARYQELRRARRTTRRFQLLSAGLVVFLIGALVASGLAIAQRRTATANAHAAAVNAASAAKNAAAAAKNAATADSNATESDARGLAAQALALSGDRTDTSLLLAVEGYRRHPSLDTETGLLDALNGARYLIGYHRNLPTDVADMAMSPDRKTLLLLTSEGALQRYDTTTWTTQGKPVRTGIDGPTVLTISWDGKYATYGAADGAHVIRLADGHQIGPTFPDAYGGQLSRDDKQVVTGGIHGQAQVFDLATGRRRAAFGPVGAVVDVSPTGEVVVASVLADASTVRRYGFDGTPLGLEMPVTSVQGIVGVGYSPDGATVFAVDISGQAQLLNGKTLAPIGASITVRGSRATDTAFQPSGDLLAIGSDDGSIRVVGTHYGRTYATLTGLSAGYLAVEWLDDHRLLAITANGAAEYDLDQTTAIGTTYPRENAISSIVPIADGSFIASEGGEVVTEKIPPAASPTLPPLITSPRHFPDITVSGNGTLLAVHEYRTENVAARDGYIQFYDLAKHRSTTTVALPGDGGDLSRNGRLAFSPDGRRLAVGTAAGQLYMVDVSSGRLLISGAIEDSTLLSALKWSADSATLYAAGQDGALKYLDPATGRATASTSLSPGTAIIDIVAVPGSPLLAVSSESGQIFLVDPRLRQLAGAPLNGGGTQLQDVAVSADGHTIAAVSRDGALRLWDRASRRPIGPPMSAHRDLTPTITYLADGSMLTGGFDADIIAWDLKPADWVARACQLAGRDLTQAEWQEYLPNQPYRRTCTDRSK